jgi:hypothetical protein
MKSKCWFCQAGITRKKDELDGSYKHYLTDGGFMGYCKDFKPCPECVNHECDRCGGSGIVYRPEFPGGKVNELES